jgi:hypothetical protein
MSVDIRDHPSKPVILTTVHDQPGLIRRIIIPMAANFTKASLVCGKNS